MRRMPTVNLWAWAVAVVGVALAVAQRDDENSHSGVTLENPPDLCCGSIVAPGEGMADTAFVTASPVVASLEGEQRSRRPKEKKATENWRLQDVHGAGLGQRQQRRLEHNQRISDINSPLSRGSGQQLVINRSYPSGRAEAITVNSMVEPEAPQESETPQSRRVMVASQGTYNAQSTSGRAGQDYGDRPPISSTRPLKEPSNSQPIEHDANLRPDFRNFINNNNAPELLSRQTKLLGPQRQTAESEDRGYNPQRQQVDEPSICCGSNIPFDPLHTQATGDFSRVTALGSVKIIDVPPKYSYPPGNVRDLQVVPINALSLHLTWTAPGEDFDFGTASGYIIRLTETKDDLQDPHFDVAPAETLLETNETLAAAGVYQTAGTRVTVEVPLARGLERGHVYYLALKAFDKLGHLSGVSNVVQFFLPRLVTGQETTFSPQVRNENAAEARSYSQGLPRENIFRTTESEGLVVSLPTTTTLTPPVAPGASRGPEAVSTELGTRDDIQEPSSSAPPPEPDSNQAEKRTRKRKLNRRRKNRKRKKNKKAKGKRCGKGNRRKSGKQLKNTDMSGPARCMMTQQEKAKQVSLCDARYSLELVIAYFTQNQETQHRDYLDAALQTLRQKEQPPWKTEDNTRDNESLIE